MPNKYQRYTTYIVNFDGNLIMAIKDRMPKITITSDCELIYTLENSKLLISLPDSFEIHFGPGPGDKN